MNIEKWFLLTKLLQAYINNRGWVAGILIGKGDNMATVEKYIPTKWVNETTPIDEYKMNHIEEQLENSQKAENLLSGIIIRDRLPVANQTERGAITLSNSLNNSNYINGVAATPKAIYDLKMNSAVVVDNDNGSRVAKKAAIADKLQNDVQINLTSGVTGTVAFSTGGTYSLNATVVPSKHKHTYEQIESYAKASTPGIVYSFSSPLETPESPNTYDVPNITYIRSTVRDLTAGINNAQTLANTNRDNLNKILALNPNYITNSTKLGQWKASFDSLLAWKEKDFANYQIEIKNNLNSLSQKDEELVQLIGATKLRIETNMALIDSVAKQNANNIKSLTTSTTEDRTLLNSVKDMVLELKQSQLQQDTQIELMKKQIDKLEQGLLNLAEHLRVSEDILFAPRTDLGK